MQKKTARAVHEMKEGKLVSGKDAEKEIQRSTDKHIAVIDTYLASKEKELMAV